MTSRASGEVLEPRVLLTAGSFDLTFGGGDGGVTAGFAGASSVVHDSGEAMAVRPDGKVIVAGYTGDGSNTNNAPAVARFTADGVLDTTFDGDGTADGKVSYPIGGGADTEVRAVALQSDGKIVLAGTTEYQAGNTWDWFVMRLNENGSLDTTFGGGDGFLTLDFGFGYGDDAHAVAIQGDGKIVVTGVGSQNTSQLATIRLNTNGTLDPTFSGDGIDMVDFFGGVDYASDVIVDPDGKIVVAGGSVVPGGNRQFVLLRYLSNGTLDSTFDGDGKASTSFGSGQSAMGRQVLRQPDGKYVVGGLVGTSSVAPYAIARYNANGSLDTTFGTNSAVPGTTLVPSVEGHIFTSYGIARQGDGKLLFGGYSEVDPSLQTYYTAVRFTDIGAPDATFGSGGIAQVSVPGATAGYNDGGDVAMSADGNILIAGAAWVNGQNDFGLVKLRATADVGGVTLSGGVLTVTGTDDANALDLSATSTTFTAVLDGVTYTFPAASVTSVNVDLKGGDDVENHNGNVPGGTVALGDGNDTLTVGTANKTSPALNVSGGLGNDTVTLGVAFFTPTNFTGDGGTDTLVYNGAQGNDDLVVTANDITNGGYDRATYATVEAVRVLGNFGYDSMRLTGVASGTSYQLDGGAGNDTITVRHATNPDGFGTSSPVTLIGGADVDEIAFDDSANIYNDTYAITPTTFTRTALVTFSYQTAETLRVTCGNGGNPINVTPSAATKVVVDGGLNPSGSSDTLTVSLAGATGTAFTPLANGSGRYTFTNLQPVEFSGVELDKTPFPPTVASAQFTYQTRQSITFTFSEDVTASLSPGDLVVTNVTTGQTIPAGSFVFDGSSPIGMQSTARWHAASPLPDGNYTARLTAGSVADPAGNTLAADYTLSFFVLGGDANHDRVVNFNDLLALASNYNKTSATFAQGDFNYDGVVNFNDLLILAKNYNKSLPAPAPAVESAAPVLAAASTASVLTDEQSRRPAFSSTRVSKPTAAKPPKAVGRPAARR